MGLSIARRRDACLHYIQSDFDIDATVRWVLREFRAEPAFLRSKNPERLARNIVTMGGQGDQQEMNAVGFMQALNLHVEGLLDRRIVQTQNELNESRAGSKRSGRAPLRGQRPP